MPATDPIQPLGIETTISKRSTIPAVLFLSLASCSSNSWTDSNFEKQRTGAIEKEDFMTWPEAESLVKQRCQEVVFIYQGHSRVVLLSFEDESSLTTISPVIDQIFAIVDACHKDPDSVEVWME